jgi:predicted amidohydrolase YtcJ
VLILVAGIPHLLFRAQDDLEADPILRGKAIILFRVDLHAVWVSKRVLELCGKLPKTVDGGEIIVDAAGNPTGVFLDNAQLLIPRPPWSVDQMVEFYQKTVTDVLSLGLTAIHDAATTEPVIELYKK